MGNEEMPLSAGTYDVNARLAGKGADKICHFEISELKRAVATYDSDASPENASQILALICPDWRAPSFAIDCETGELAYANWRALRLFRSLPYVRVNAGRLVFEDERHNALFYAVLRKFVAGDMERDVLMLPIEEHGDVVTIALYNPIGLFREVMVRGLRRWRPEGRIAVAEISVTGAAPDPTRIAAFAEAFGLDKTEARLVELIGWGVSARGEHRGMLPLDARRTLRAIMAKTGCIRASQLVRLIAFTCRVT
jgi:hypothetical protein